MFIVTERTMNGTVTMNINSSILDFKVWEEAIKYFIEKYKLGIEIVENNDQRLVYWVKNGTGFPIYGFIENQKAKVL